MDRFPYGALLAVIALVALAVLALVLLSLWRKTKALTRVVATASETVATSMEALEQSQAAAPARARPPAQSGTDTRRSPARHR